MGHTPSKLLFKIIIAYVHLNFNNLSASSNIIYAPFSCIFYLTFSCLYCFCNRGVRLFLYEQAIDKAKTEYKKYQARTLSEVEQAYLDCIDELNKKTGNNHK